MNAVINLSWNSSNRASDYLVHINGGEYSTSETSIETTIPENTWVSWDVTARNSAGQSGTAYSSFQVPPYGDHPPDQPDNLNWTIVRWE